MRGALLLIVVVGAPLGAQDVPRVGEMVEARIAGADDPMLGHFCVAPLAASAGDTLVLTRTASCAPGSHVARIRLQRDNRGSRLTHAALGFVGGAVLGGVLARVSGSDGCANGVGCDVMDAGYVDGIATAASVGLGALIGTALGLVLPAGKRWVDTGSERPIRIGRIDVHPELRVSIGTPGR